MPKPWYSIKAAAAGAESSAPAEVSILDAISPYYGVDAKTFLTAFRALKEQNVNVYINSPGGSVFEGLAILNGMRATGKNITVHILGIAASIASVIAMAGHKIVMPKNTMMFLHNPINGVYGNAEEMREMADVLDKIGTSMTATYAKRWKGDDKELADVLAAESYLTADECLKYGLCDEVTDEITAEARFEVETLPEQVQALFKRTQPVAARTGVPVAEVERIAEELGVAEHAASLAVDPKLVTLDLVRAAAAEARDIVALCRLTGRVEAAAPYVRARTSIADVRAALNAALVEADAQAAVDTAAKTKTVQGPQAKAEFNPFAVWDGLKTKTWSTQ